MDQLKEIRDELKIVRESQVRMEEDIRHHIRRTDILESRVEPMYGAYSALKWVVALIVTVGLVLTNLEKILEFFR